VPRAGPYAAFLGGAFNPIWTEFKGKASRTAIKTLQDQKIQLPASLTAALRRSRFELPTATTLPADITLDRLNRRRTLVEQFDHGRRDLERSTSGKSLDRLSPDGAIR